MAKESKTSSEADTANPRKSLEVLKKEAAEALEAWRAAGQKYNVAREAFRDALTLEAKDVGLILSDAESKPPRKRQDGPPALIRIVEVLAANTSEDGRKSLTQKEIKAKSNVNNPSAPLRDLVENKLIARDLEDGGSRARYWITRAGKESQARS